VPAAWAVGWGAMSEPEASGRIWRQLRAGLILLAIVIALLDGAPIPPVKKAPESLRPAVAWMASTRRTLMKPFRPFGDLFRLRQQYKLFPGARRQQHLMWVESRRQGETGWELLYRPNDPAHDLMRHRIEFRRMRGAWNPGSRGTQLGYGPFAHWVAGEIFARDEEVEAVRVRMEKIVLRPRQGGYLAEGEFEHQKIERRSKWERRRAQR
jgi:hypothetical protein